jgi:hypothetical protein
MRTQAAVVLVLATTAVAEAQCPIGSFPTMNSNAQIICQSAAGQSQGGLAPTICPPGAYPSMDSWGRRTCSTLDEPRRGSTARSAPDRRRAPLAVGRSDRYDETDRFISPDRDRDDRSRDDRWRDDR